MGISDLILLLGGVSLFLFGMTLMGDGLKKVAGNKLEVILYKLSGTPVKGILLGTGVTAVIQSSSAVSIMAVGFVNSSMMKVRQAISVIMGAIVGTSITGWIISLSQLSSKSAALSLLSTESISATVAIIGICLKLFGKKRTNKRVGDILLGFSVLMFGMKTMSQSVEVLKTNGEFVGILTSFKNPFLGILAGLLVTSVLQSSSASVGILQALSTTGAITFDVALPIILGISIGASVPVMISSVGSGTNGKRTAFSYPVVEILRVLLFSLVFYGLNPVFKFSFANAAVNMVSIALLNSVFRVFTVAALSPFTRFIEKIVNWLVKEEKVELDKGLEERFLAYPPLAVEQSRLAMIDMADKTRQNVILGMNILFNYSDKGFELANELEDAIDKYEDRIGTYLMKLTGREMTKEQRMSVSKYLHALTDFERISDHALNIAESAKEIREKNIVFSEEAKKEIGILQDAILEVVETAVKSFIDDDVTFAKHIEPLEQTIDLLCVQVRDHHISRLQNGLCTFEHSFVFNDLLTNFERISDHCSNIGVALIELMENTMASHEFEDRIKAQDSVFRELYTEYQKKYKLQ